MTDLDGGAGADTMIGDGGDDILSGEGGADTMSGGTGDDLCFVDNAGDVVIENANEGTDQIYSTVSYTISANVENMNLTGRTSRALATISTISFSAIGAAIRSWASAGTTRCGGRPAPTR